MSVAVFIALCAVIVIAGLVAPRQFVLFTCALAGFPMALLFGGSVALSWAGGLSPQAVYMLAILIGSGLVVIGNAGLSMPIVSRLWIYGVFLGFVTLSLVWAPGFSDALRMLAKWITPPMFLLASCCAARQGNRSLPVATVIAGGAAVATLLAAANVLGGGVISPLSEASGFGSLPALTTPMNSPANFCFLIVVAALIALVRFLDRKSLTSSLLLALLATAVLLAFVRIGMIAMAAGALAITLLRQRGVRSRAGLIWAGVVVLAFALLFASDAMQSRMFFSGSDANWSTVMENPASIFELVNTSGRSELWARALQYFDGRSTLFGAGVGAVDGWINAGYSTSELHSEALRIWIETGAAGTLLWVCALAQLLRVLMQKRRDLQRAGGSTLPVEMAFGAVVAYAMTLLTDNSLNYVTEFAIAVFGMAGYALAQQPPDDASGRAPAVQGKVEGIRPPANFVDVWPRESRPPCARDITATEDGAVKMPNVTRLGPSIWALLSMLSTRAAGFLITLIIARTAGPSALGVYSSVINTASSLALPFQGVVANNATLMSARAASAPKHRLESICGAHLTIALAISGVSILVLFAGRHALLAPLSTGYSQALVMAAAASVLTGQLLASVLQGLYQGSGNVAKAARRTLATSLAGALLAWPVIRIWGVNGTLLLLMVSSLLPPAALLVGLRVAGPGGIPPTLWKEFWQRLTASIPFVAATAAGAVVSWLCTVYYVGQAHGVASIGLIAVAAQWLTLMLLPATSWGGLALRELAEATAHKGSGRIRAVVVKLIGKNLLATVALGIVVSGATVFIASLYKLNSTELVPILRVNCLIAVASAVTNVMERLFICINRQGVWLLLSLVAFAMQLIITRVWIADTLLAVPWAQVASTSCLALCSGTALLLLAPLRERQS